MKRLIITYVGYASGAVSVPDDFDIENDEITDEMYDEAYAQVHDQRPEWEVDFSEDPELED